MNAPVSIEWTRDPAELEQTAKFFARVISNDPSYISHGEIQTALSLDGMTWRSDLEMRFIESMRNIDSARGVVLARNEAHELVGASIVHWSQESAEAPFATIEDLAVEPANRKSGVGASLVRAIVLEARAKGMRWLMLESGKRNHAAHAFFEGQSFELISHVFARKL
ncbi:MAG: GNAT family N-acetyltransferase [Proteobacteria bacterium]|nr:GNAT family N-acetyltransferase [Pseudomonadota bacterium]